MGKRRILILILGFILALRGAIGQSLPDACPGSKVMYSVQGLPNSIFSWTVQGGTIITSYNDSIVIQWGNKSGSYQLSVTEITQFNCTGPQILATVNVGGDTANLGGNQAICLGDMATFTPDKPFASYLWSDGSAQSFLKTGIPGVVWVKVTNSAGCVSVDSASLTVNKPMAIDLGIDRPICDTPILLTGPDAASYNWTVNFDNLNTNYTTPSITVSKEAGNQIVSLQIIDKNGCTNTDTVKFFACDTKLGIMNTITANDDGHNDIWIIKNIELYPKAVISLYDRWGRLVYMKAGNYQNTDLEGFKGKSAGGSYLPMDSYFYVIDLKNGSKPVTGYLLIIR
jgi:gliding motility-associated-like protein